MECKDDYIHRKDRTINLKNEMIFSSSMADYRILIRDNLEMVKMPVKAMIILGSLMRYLRINFFVLSFDFDRIRERMKTILT